MMACVCIFGSIVILPSHQCQSSLTQLEGIAGVELLPAPLILAPTLRGEERFIM